MAEMLAGRGAVAELPAGAPWGAAGRGAAVAEILLARSTVAELLPAAAGRHNNKKRE